MTSPVRARREALGLTCAQLARSSGVSEVTLWRVETARVEPLLSTQILLAAALQTDPGALFPKRGS